MMDHHHLEGYFFLTLLIGVLVLTTMVFAPYFDALVLAATFAVLFTPLYRFLLRHLGNREAVAALITTAIACIVILIPLGFVATQIVGQATALYGKLSVPGDLGAMSPLGAFAEKLSIPIRPTAIEGYVRDALGWALGHIGSVFSGFLSAIGFISLSLLGLYYALKDASRLERTLGSLMPLAPEHTDAIMEKLRVTVNSVVRGSLLVAVVQGILTGIGFWIAGVPNPIVWGTMGIVTSLIPMIGTAIIIVPAVVYLALIANPLGALILALWGLFIVGTIDNIIRPYIVERGINIHPFLILLSVLGGIGLFGPIGFLAGPLLLSLLFALLDIYSHQFLAKRA